MQIITNYHWNNFLYGYELTDKEKADFDYVDDIYSHSFVRYRGAIVDPDNFMVLPCGMNESAELQDWQGYQSDSYFSGLVIRYSDDMEQYQIGTYIS